MDNQMDDRIGLRVDIFSIVKDICRQWWVILILAVSVSLFANIWVKETYSPQYQTKTTFAVVKRGVNGSIYQDLNSAKDAAKQFSKILESNLLKRKVAQELGVEKLNVTTKVYVIPETNIIELSVSAGSAMEAFHAIHAIMRNYGTVSDYLVGDVIMNVIQQPYIPMNPSNSINVNGIMKKSFLLTALVTMLLFALMSFIRDTVKNEREVGEKIDARLLGTICHERKAKTLRDITKMKNFSLLITNPLVSFQFMESNKMTASKIRSRMDSKEIKTLMVTSVMENEGKSTVAANLALSLAQEGRKVLLLDFDFKKPAQYKIFNVPKDKAEDLSEMFAGKTSWQKLVKKYKEDNLYLMLNGSIKIDVESMLDSKAMYETMNSMKEVMDFVIIDTSPMALVSDAEEIAQFADASVLVIKQDRVLAKAINDAVDVLNNTNGKVLGCIFNDASAGIADGMSHYGYGGHYGKRAE